MKIGNRLFYPQASRGMDREAVAAICRALGDLGGSEKLIFWLSEHGALAGKLPPRWRWGQPWPKWSAWPRHRRASEALRLPLRLTEPGSFEDLLRRTRIEVASPVRLSRRLATEPYGSAGVYRFDDPDAGGADAFGTCYNASTIEVAFAESVMHECGRFVKGSYRVPSAELTERSVVRFACERRKTLLLADLTGATLEALGLNNDISASADCAASQAWARAIHSAGPRWDGIRCVSRQMNKGFAYATFERSGLRKMRAEKLRARQVDDLCVSLQRHRSLTAPRSEPKGRQPGAHRPLVGENRSAPVGQLPPLMAGRNRAS